MGRHTTGAITTGGALRLELTQLRNLKYIQRNSIVSGQINWTNGSNIGFTSCLKENEKWVQLRYVLTDRNTGEKYDYDYKIYLTGVPSNLEKGEVLYFVCPITGRRARILYKCYGSHTWKCRQAYKTHIYYSGQNSSKLSYHNDRYWNLDSQIKELSERIYKNHYRNQPTRIRQRYDRLTQLRDYYDSVWWNIWPKSLQKIFRQYYL